LVKLLQLFIAAMDAGEKPAHGGEADVAGQPLKDRAHVRPVTDNETIAVTPLALLIKTAGLEKSNVVDLELVRLRTKNKAEREAWGLSGPDQGER
jgi:hypothetical protein